MREHIDMAPVWDAYREDCECPLCLLRAKAEAANVSYFLGESVMEPDQRIKVNQNGFCARHFRMMYEAGNRLGLGLITHTYLKETIKELGKIGDGIRAAAASDGDGRKLFRKNSSLRQATEPLKVIEDKCIFCDAVKATMHRYVYTLLYMYRKEPEFPTLLRSSKGFCLMHYRTILEAAAEYLKGEELKHFVDTVVTIEMENLQRLEGEIEWFTKKFDYKNEDKPWGNSRDAVKRTINKLREMVVEKDG